MKIDEHRKEIVRAIIRGVSRATTYDTHVVGASQREDDQHCQGDTCAVTGMYFPDVLSEMMITWSNVGPLWMGLWLDSPLKLDDERDGGHGNTLFPRWLAEILNEECDLGIEEEDIY